MSTSLQAPAGATALSAWMQSRTLLGVCCLLPAQAWGITWAQPRNHMPRHFGEARLESPGSVCPCGAQRGWHWARGSSGEGHTEGGSPQQAPTTHLQCLSCKCSAHTTPISVIYLIFFSLLVLFFVASTFLLFSANCAKVKKRLNLAGTNKLCCSTRKAYFTDSRNKNKTKNGKQPFPHHIWCPQKMKIPFYSLSMQHNNGSLSHPAGKAAWPGCCWPLLLAFGRLCPRTQLVLEQCSVSHCLVHEEHHHMVRRDGNNCRRELVVEARAILSQGKSTGMEKCRYTGQMDLETTVLLLSDSVFCF